MQNKLKKYGKVAAVATLVPVTLSVGLASQTNEVAFATTPEAKVSSVKNATSAQQVQLSESSKLSLKVVPVGSANRRIEGTATASTVETRKVVQVTINNGTTLTQDVDSEGKWTVILPETIILHAGDTLDVKVSDGKNVSKKTVKVVQSVAAPTLNALQPFSKVFTGKGIPGYTVHLYEGENPNCPLKEIATVKVNSFGNWSITGETFYAASWSNYQVIQEKNGLYSYPSALVVPYDTIAPAMPFVNAVYDTSRTIKGGGDEDSGSVIIKFPNGTEVKKSISTKSWEITIPANVKLEEGDIITVQLADYNENMSPKTLVRVLASEKVPTVPSVNGIVTDQTSISGTATAGNIVKVTFENGQVVSTKVNANGSWNVNVPSDLKLKYKNRVTVTQINAKGVKSGDTVVQVQPGEVEVPTVNPITEGTKKVTGTGKPGAEVVVFYNVSWNEQRATWTKVGKDGKWSAEVESQYMFVGKEINVTQVYDTALSSTLHLGVIAATKLPTPKINQFYVGDTKITGTGIVGNTITVTLPNGKSLTTTVDATGKWSIAVPQGVVLKEDKKITATQTNASGVTSAVVKIYVEEK